MKIMLEKVRLSYPNLFKPRAADAKAQPKFSASFLLDKKDDAKQITELRTAVKKVAGDQWDAKLPKGVRFCVRDGAEKAETPGYGAEVIFISASNEHRVPVVDRARVPLAVEDGKPYAGCYVNATVRLWAQDNQYGKRINAQLLGVQFVDDGEAFGEKPFNADEEFPDLTEGEEAGEENANSSAKGSGKKTATAADEAPDDDEIPF